MDAARAGCASTLIAMHSLPIIAIALLLSGGALVWVSGVLCVPRIRRYLSDQAIALADSSYQVPELHDYVTARNFAKTRGHNLEFLKRHEWLNFAAFCLVATGLALVLACDLMGIRSGPAGSSVGSIPNWTIVYLVLFLAAAVRRVRTRAKRREPVWLTTVERMADLGRAIVFASYWVTEVFMGFQGIAPFLFACSWAVFGSRCVWSSLHDRTDKHNINLPKHQKRILMWITLALMTAMNFPVFWFGLKAAVRGVAVAEFGP